MTKNDILVIYGSDIKQKTRQLLEAAQLDELIGSKDKKIGLKPNLVIASEASDGATTHPQIAEAIIEYLQERGFKNLTILEGSWVGDRTEIAFKVCGYAQLAKRYGVKLVDTQKDTFREYDCTGVTINICDSAMDIDFMINLPVLKGHCQTGVTGALKNNKGIIPNSEKQRFHRMGLHHPIAHLNTRVRNDFILVDSICGDLNFEEGGNPIEMNRLIASTDPVLCDAYICSLMGYSIEEVPYIQLAAKLEVGKCDISAAKITELNRPESVLTERPSGRAAELGRFAKEDQSCSACYAALIHALDRFSMADSLSKIPPLCIGQGFKNKKGTYGIGNCTRGFESYAAGCPPSAADIVQYLKKISH